MTEEHKAFRTRHNELLLEAAKLDESFGPNIRWHQQRFDYLCPKYTGEDCVGGHHMDHPLFMKSLAVEWRRELGPKKFPLPLSPVFEFIDDHNLDRNAEFKAIISHPDRQAFRRNFYNLGLLQLANSPFNEEVRKDIAFSAANHGDKYEPGKGSPLQQIGQLLDMSARHGTHDVFDGIKHQHTRPLYRPEMPWLNQMRPDQWHSPKDPEHSMATLIVGVVFNWATWFPPDILELTLPRLRQHITYMRGVHDYIHRVTGAEHHGQKDLEIGLGDLLLQVS